MGDRLGSPSGVAGFCPLREPLRIGKPFPKKVRVLVLLDPLRFRSGTTILACFLLQLLSPNAFLCSVASLERFTFPQPPGEGSLRFPLLEE